MSRQRLALFVATVAGVGYVPVAPGTFGSLAGLGAAWLLLSQTGWPAWSLAIGALLLTPIASWACGVVEKDLGVEDPGLIVIDEVVGQWLALALIRPERPLDWFIGLTLFRVFDVWKPGPIRSLEKIPNGWGVVADDFAAGACAMMTFAVIRALDGGF
jgi:phosphatidylglycerophosphatase A